MNEPRVLVGKRYGNHLGRRFVRVAVEIAERPGWWWVTDLVSRDAHGQSERFAGVEEIRGAARVAYAAVLNDEIGPATIRGYRTGFLPEIGFRLPAPLARDLTAGRMTTSPYEVKSHPPASGDGLGCDTRCVPSTRGQEGHR